MKIINYIVIKDLTYTNTKNNIFLVRNKIRFMSEISVRNK